MHALELCNGEFSDSLKTLLSWLQYDITNKPPKFSSPTEWTDFTRRVCYFNSRGSKDLFKNIMPSDSALKLHCFRGEYVLKLAMESCDGESDTYKNLNDGWEQDTQQIKVKWEEDIASIKKTLSYQKPRLTVQKCTCKHCSDSGRGKCRSCWAKCKACNYNCSCKALCDNPHNNGGSCAKCTHEVSNEASDLSSTHVQNYDESDLQEPIPPDEEDDSEDEDEAEDINDNSDFNTYFKDNGYDGFITLAQVATLDDSDIDDDLLF